MIITLVRMDLGGRTGSAGSVPVMRGEKVDIRYDVNKGRNVSRAPEPGPGFPRRGLIEAEAMTVMARVGSDIEAEREIVCARTIALMSEAIAPRERHIALCKDTMTVMRHGRARLA